MSERLVRTDIMLADKYSAKRIEGWRTAFYQAKIDGIRCRAVWERDAMTLYSSSGQEINSVPILKEVLSDICADYPVGHIHLDGELVVPGEPFSITQSLVKRNGPHKDEDKVSYVVFDVISMGGIDLDYTQRQRAAALAVFGKLFVPPIHMLPMKEDHANEDTVLNWLGQFIHANYEGVIIRNPDAYYDAAAPRKSKCILKLKTVEIDSFAVVGRNILISDDTERQGLCGSLSCETASGEVFRVGSGPAFTLENRRKLWVGKLPSHAKIKFQELTERGVPRFPIAMEVKYDT